MKKNNEPCPCGTIGSVIDCFSPCIWRPVFYVAHISCLPLGLSAALISQLDLAIDQKWHKYILYLFLKCCECMHLFSVPFFGCGREVFPDLLHIFYFQDQIYLHVCLYLLYSVFGQDVMLSKKAVEIM